MNCLQLLFLFSLAAFVGVLVYGLVATGQRQGPDDPFPPIVDPWAATGRRITDPGPADDIYRGAKK